MSIFKNTGSKSFEEVLTIMDPEWTPNSPKTQSTSTGKGAKGSKTSNSKNDQVSKKIKV